MLLVISIPPKGVRCNRKIKLGAVYFAVIDGLTCGSRSDLSKRRIIRRKKNEIQVNLKALDVKRIITTSWSAGCH